MRRRLSHAQSMQLTFTEIIALSPGAEAQFLHRDELLYEGFPFPLDYEVHMNSLWALTDYTEEMGATRVVPGSHRVGLDASFTQADAVTAEMARGSVLVLSGKLVHGGGHNRSDRVRKALDLGSCPVDVARSLPEELLLLMGYDTAHGYGHIGRDHPLAALGRR